MPTANVTKVISSVECFTKSVTPQDTEEQVCLNTFKYL